MIENTVWVEKYRPMTIDDLVLPDNLSRKVNAWLSEKDVPHLVFAGDPGSGKSTLAMILRDSISGIDNSLTINASEETSIEIVRTKVLNFAKSQSFGDIKICLLEEFEQLSPSAQKSLKRIIEDYSQFTRFILTTNHSDRIEPAILSRCQTINFQSFTRKQMLKRLAEIMVNEKVKGELTQLELIIDAVGSDMRAAINKLQYASLDGKLTITKEMLSGTDINFKVLKLLNEKKLTEIRQAVIDAMVKDFTPLYKFLFDHVDEIGHGKEEDVMMIIGDYLDRDSSIADREINFACCMLKIMVQ